MVKLAHLPLNYFRHGKLAKKSVDNDSSLMILAGLLPWMNLAMYMLLSGIMVKLTRNSTIHQKQRN